MRMKIFFLIIFYLIFSVKLSFAEKIESINVQGNNRISDETIIIFSKFNIGDVLNNENANKIIKNLYETNFFKEVSVNSSNSILNIQIVENPIIQNISILGIKNKNTIKAIEAQLTIKEKGSFINVLINKEINRINNYLRSGGYYFSTVSADIVYNNNDTVNINYNIITGDKAVIKEIKFTGNKVLKNNKLKRLIISEEDKFWKFISKKKYLNEAQIKTDVNLLQNYFKNSGYYNIKINSSVAKYVEKNHFDLVFNIDAGERIFFDKTNLVLPSDYKKDNFAEILNQLEEFKDQPYSLSRINKVLSEIDKIALSKQYEFINARFDEKVVQNKLNLTITVDESKKFYINRIDIAGNNITNEKAIRNMLIVDEGDPFNELLNTRSINKIKASNLFANVTQKIVESDDLKKDLVITVEEKATGELSAGAGVSSTGSTFTASIKENNFNGNGVKLNTTLTFTANSVKGGIDFLIPNFNYSDKDLSFNLSRTETDNLTVSGYKNSATNVFIGTGFEYKQDLFFNPGVNLEYKDLETSSSASSILKKQEGNYFTADVDYSLFYDARNQSYEPTDGYYSKFTQSLPIIANNYSILNTYDFKKYHEFSEQFIGSLSLYLTAINSIDNEDVLISERITLPSSRLKGFEKGKIGPKDGSEFIGGNYASSVSLNSTLPKIFPDLQSLEFGMFINAGNVWGVDYNSALENNKIRSAAGFTIDFFTPIGPINFVLAQPITKANTDVEETFRFDIGTSF